MIPNIVLPQFFVPQDSIKLGRFITSIDDPYQNYHDPTRTKPTLAVISHRDGYSGVHNVASTSGFGAALTSLMSAGFSKRANIKVRIVTDRVATSTLQNSDSWFEEATQMPATRRWLERQIDQGYDIYMIVGLHTVTNTHIIQDSSVGTATAGQIQLPTTLSLAAVGFVAPLGDIINPSASRHHQNLAGAQAQFSAPGTQVCALQCRKVRHAWLSSRRLDKSRLSRPWWPSVEKWRDEEEGEDDIIEVELSEVGALDEGWDKEVMQDEVLLIRSYAN